MFAVSEALPDIAVAQLSNVTAALSISCECLLYSCVCAAVQQSDRVCVVRVGLQVDSLCSRLSGFPTPALKVGGVGLLSLELLYKRSDACVPTSQKRLPVLSECETAVQRRKCRLQ